MKKILFVLALLASMQVADAQVKSANAAKAAVESAKAAVDNVKKNTKSTTWIKYGQALMDAYNSPAGNIWQGMTDQDLQLVGEKATSEEQTTVNGQPMVKKIYSNKNLYFDQNGKLAVIEVTKPVVDGALDKALEAYKQAAKIDNGSKNKDIADGIKAICDKYNEEAVNAYTFGKFAEAATLFNKTFETSQVAPLSQLDTAAIYNAGLVSVMGGDYAKGKEYFEKSVKYGYYGEDGEAYAKLGEVYDKLGDKAASKAIFEEGFSKFPQSQGILIGLINYYINSGEDTGRLFKLLDDAKKNEPGNASLYYVEGNIHSKLGNEEAAIAAWDKCAEINPAYEFGYIGKGLYFYNKAADLQKAASEESDDAKYMKMMEDFEKYLKGCVEPIEKAFEITKDDETKASLATYLKSVCFILRNDPEYQAKYDKYAPLAQ